MKRNNYFFYIAAIVFIGFVIYFGLGKFELSKQDFNFNKKALAEKFDYLSQNGNSSCSVAFRESISSMPDTRRLRGSCCSPMSWHRYSEQVEGLKKYRNIPEIPPDPYDIEASLAKGLMSYYDMKLTPEEQKVYDYAMENSNEKGPCCCKCWRWYVYGGLGKYLIRNYKFTGEQVAEVWNLSDGCGGDEHNH
jgi:hypothetical protein